MVEAVRYHDPTDLAESIERGAHLVGGSAGAVDPESTAREPYYGSSRSQANTAEPYRALAHPYRVRHDDIEEIGTSHPGRLSLFDAEPAEKGF